MSSHARFYGSEGRARELVEDVVEPTRDFLGESPRHGCFGFQAMGNGDAEQQDPGVGYGLDGRACGPSDGYGRAENVAFACVANGDLAASAEGR